MHHLFLEEAGVADNLGEVPVWPSCDHVSFCAVKEPDDLLRAPRAARFLRDRLYDAEAQSLSRTYRDGRRNAWGFAEDYALVIQGLLDLYEATYEPRWLREARALSDEMIERFQLDPRKRCSSYSKGNRQKIAIIAMTCISYAAMAVGLYAIIRLAL